MIRTMDTYINSEKREERETYSFRGQDRPMRQENQGQQRPETFSILVSNESKQKKKKIIFIQTRKMKTQETNQREREREKPDHLNQDDGHGSVMEVVVECSKQQFVCFLLDYSGGFPCFFFFFSLLLSLSLSASLCLFFGSTHCFTSGVCLFIVNTEYK